MSTTVEGEPEIVEYALACATDALYHQLHPDSPIAREDWGYPAPLHGPVRNQAQIVIAAYLKALRKAGRSP